MTKQLTLDELDKLLKPSQDRSLDDINSFLNERGIQESYGPAGKSDLLADTPPGFKPEPSATSIPQNQTRSVASASQEEPSDISDTDKIKDINEDKTSAIREMLEAFEARRKNQLIAGVADAGARIGHAIAGVKYDPGMMSGLQKNADQPVEDFQQRQKMTDLQQKLDLQKQMRDPNAPIAKILQDMGRKMGLSEEHLKGMSAEEGQKILSMWQSHLDRQEAVKMRQAINNQTIQDRKDRRLKTDNERLFKLVDNERTLLGKSKPYEDYRIISNKAKSIENLAKNPSAFGDIGTIFNYMKALDPGSVVRESEYATAAGAGDLHTRWQNLVSSAKDGTILQPKQRAELVKFSQDMSRIAKQGYASFAAPHIKRVVDAGGKLDYVLPGDVDINDPEFSKALGRSDQQSSNSVNQSSGNNSISQEEKLNLIDKYTEHRLKQLEAKGN